jgi:SAM-dependent methyltransferase
MESQAYEQMAESEAHHWWFVARRQIIGDQLHNIIPSGRVDAVQILEVGCGTGGNLDMLTQFGHVSALEMDASALAFSKLKAGERVEFRHGSAPDGISFPPNSFDLICMLDVLEHIDQDAETLNALRRLLKPGGQILITVPAYQWLWSSHDEFLHHKRRYSRPALNRLMIECGYEPLRMTYFNTFLLPLVAIVRLKERLSDAKSPTGHEVPRKILNDALRRIFSSESKLLAHLDLPFGVSLLTIARDSNPQSTR